MGPGKGEPKRSERDEDPEDNKYIRCLHHAWQKSEEKHFLNDNIKFQSSPENNSEQPWERECGKDSEDTRSQHVQDDMFEKEVAKEIDVEPKKCKWRG